MVNSNIIKDTVLDFDNCHYNYDFIKNHSDDYRRGVMFFPHVHKDNSIKKVFLKDDLGFLIKANREVAMHMPTTISIEAEGNLLISIKRKENWMRKSYLSDDQISIATDWVKIGGDLFAAERRAAEKIATEKDATQRASADRVV